MALNLVRNSRVYFTTNVDSVGVIGGSTGTAAPGYLTTNTQEIQVLDGFTFSQNTNSDTVTISEAGTAPSRGQRSFNTSLAPVDFSFSTYVRPFKDASEITAEESVLWNALLSTVAQKTSATFSAATSFAGVYDSTAGTIVFTSTGNLTHSLKVDDIIILTGITASPSTEFNNINAPAVVTQVSTTGAQGTVTVKLLAPKFGTATTLTVGTSVTYYTSGWANIATTQSIATTAGSNSNQLQKFGMIFQVDNVTYAVDNCAMNQATIDFGLDGIATIQWAGQSTALREISTTGSIIVTNTAITNLPSTDNIFVGNVVRYTGTGGAASVTSTGGSNITIATVDGPTSLTLSSGSTSGFASDFKVYNFQASGTISNLVGSASPWTVTLTFTGTNPTQGISVGDSISATSGTGTWGTGTATVKQVTGATTLVVQFAGGSAPVIGSGGVTNVYTQIASLGGGSVASSITAKTKQLNAGYITNKLSTVDFTLINAFKDSAGSTVAAAGTVYKMALTGGSITINNNITYITPANLGVVNVPNVYYTGTRSIIGTINAYLKTGTGEGGTGQLLADMLKASTTSIEPMASLSIGVGGKTDATTRVILEMPSVTFTIPSVDVQQVVSTAINFTAAGSTLSSTANASVFAVDKTNDLLIRYFAA